MLCGSGVIPELRVLGMLCGSRGSEGIPELRVLGMPCGSRGSGGIPELRCRVPPQKLEDQERRALHQMEQLQREQRHLQRQLEKLGLERVRIDSIGSSLSSERSDSDRGESPRRGTAGGRPGPVGTPTLPIPPAEEMDVDVESTDDLPADLDWSSSSPSDSDERGSLQSLGSDEGYSSSGGTRARLAGSPKLPVGI
ncbi:max dimerization protein 1 isoform X3 [Poecile atricapillus]|uniref:max dimerization protein 1 isoform X3 n=1 Tax=Poecile atricapillus TaxID=48891 RepID=UPI002738F586|nr:max dimerization protein 1 isoform X3 [Poecile atricapillus]